MNDSDRDRIDELLCCRRALASLPPPAECEAIRRRAGLSLQLTAFALGVDWKTLRSWELGTHTPREKHGIRYAALLTSLQEAR
jgi:DNA-binding transcriptional regulator YiaG